ncbi:hypothetical protein KJ885_05645 [Patescibacteria group bacterium]|nr:hypothetical protein [Patescibacteria group bacterium]
MFERFSFSKRQVRKYLQSALRDFDIASASEVPEVAFRFCYDALLKLAIAVCAANGLRVKSKQGHHIELVKKLSMYLNDAEIEIMAGQMRSKRNWDLYGGGVLISQKEAKEYIVWAKEVIKNGRQYIKTR